MINSTNIFFFQKFITISCILAVAQADERSHQMIQHGHAPPHGHQIIKGHHDHHAVVHQQPHTAPQDVHNPYHGKEKYHAAAIHPAHGPLYRTHPVIHYHPAPPPRVVYHPAPPPKIVYHPVHVPTPPVYTPAKPLYKPEPVYENIPAHYSYEYGVNDEYVNTHFGANESRDGYATSGEYRVALPDGRTQVVKYTVADAYSGYVADVTYEGEATYAHPKQQPESA